MPDNQSADTIHFSEAEIAAYLRDTEVTDSHSLGDIATAVRVIARYEVDDPARNAEMVVGAMGNIISWAGDYGVVVTEDEISA